LAVDRGGDPSDGTTGTVVNPALTDLEGAVQKVATLALWNF